MTKKNCRDREFHLVRLNSAPFMVFFSVFGVGVLINSQKGKLNMRYIEITNISLLGSALNQEDCGEDYDRDEGSLIKTITCVQLSVAFV